MAHGLPDFQSSVEATLTEVTSIQHGLDASKSASPASGDAYLATNTGILYVCFTDGSWTNIGNLYLLLAGGTMSGAIAMGTNKITGLAAPAAAADAARKTDVDTVDAKLDDVSWSEPTRAIGTEYTNDSGKIMFVAVAVYLANGDQVVPNIGSTSPAATPVGNLLIGGTGVTGQFGCSFIVPPGWYYKLTKTGAPSLTEWHEWLLH